MATNFGAIDYSVLIGTVVVSLSIGIFFAILDKKKKRTSSNDYFLAGQSSRTIPVTLSYVVTFQSSLMVLANPVEVYNYGMIYCFFFVGLLFAAIFSSLVIVPVFYPLKITSVYRYFSLRYGDNLVRYLAVFTGVVYSVFYMGTVIFGTCVAVEVLMGIPYWVTVLIFTIVTTIYTSIGGIKAVIWTDVFQFIIMFCGLLAVLIKTTIDVGGTANVTKLGHERLVINEIGLNPTIRYTIWNLAFGSIPMYLHMFFSQSGIQRISSTSSVMMARHVYIFSMPIYALLQIMAAYQGVTLFVYYSSRGCDILRAGLVNNVNELLPFSIAQIFHNIPGINGLFIASLSSAALSTLSSCLSSLSAITYEDVLRVKYPDMDDKKATLLSKFTVLVYGLVGMTITFLISKMPGSVSVVFQSIMGCIDGPTAAIFVLALLFKRGTSKGIFIGGLCGMAVSFWLIMGNITSNLPADKQLPSGPIDKCWLYTNKSNSLVDTSMVFYNSSSQPIGIDVSDSTMGLPIRLSDSYSTTSLPMVTNEVQYADLTAVEKLYAISYIYFSLIGFLVTIMTSVVISYVTKPPRHVDEKYVFSFRKHVMADLFGKGLNTNTKHNKHKDGSQSEEMREFL